jgi:hypothetical protein
VIDETKTTTAVAVVVPDPLGPPAQAPATDPTNDYRVKPPPACEGCGGPAHGPINQLIACLTRHMRVARNEAPARMPVAMCRGCGRAHQSHDQHVACLEVHLADARARTKIGVSPAEFAENQRTSKLFEQRRGKNKKGGGQ